MLRSGSRFPFALHSFRAGVIYGGNLIWDKVDNDVLCSGRVMKRGR